MNRKQHWENIYETKKLEEVSWYQPKPDISLELIQQSGIAKDAAIIDIGGGDSFLVDNLLEEGYKDVTVLDISEKAIERAKERLGERAESVSWIISDIAEFKPDREYDLWHDRAAFHFLTDKKDQQHYVNIASEGIANGGSLIIGTFSKNGPEKCSGLEIKQYSEEEMSDLFAASFQKQSCKEIIHNTPFDTTQSFLFCRFITV